MRGKVTCSLTTPQAHGITPAYAGKSVNRCISQHRNWDHPRVCGEKRVAVAKPAAAPGSPPRMRGKESQRLMAHTTRRITPAYAGKRPRFSGSLRPTGDHPRVCGEKLLHHLAHLCAQGSPPRMRGKVKQSLNAASSHGITPAYAGKSF